MKKIREQLKELFQSLRWWHALATLALVVLAVSIFFELAGDVWLKEGFAWDPPVMLFFGNLRSPIGMVVMQVVTMTASGWIVLPALAATAWFVKRGDRRQATLLALGFLVAILLNTALKTAFARPRPHIIVPLTVGHTASFPSGHTISAAVFYGYLALQTWHHRHRTVALLVGAWPLLVGVSRIYLGVHYPSDVIASLALGLLFLVFMDRIRAFLANPYRIHKVAA
jgi:membrane-associated phospholipid phosphatase